MAAIRRMLRSLNPANSALILAMLAAALASVPVAAQQPTSAQASAIRHALSRALCRVTPDVRPALKKAGLLTRDPREVERKKYGRHKARKRPQYSKR